MSRIRDAWLVLTGKAFLVRGTNFVGTVTTSGGIAVGPITYGSPSKVRYYRIPEEF